MTTASADDDLAVLAKGGQQNFLGFLLRLLARLPFLFIAGRLYGSAALGTFASALVVVELVALVCALGEKRGLAQRLSAGEGEGPPANLVYDGMLLALLASLLAAGILYLFPAPLFPSGQYTALDQLIVLAIPGYALTEIVLAAQAYRYDIATTVRARAVVEPWTISILAGAFYFVIPQSGLEMAYLASIYAGLAAALWPFVRSYGAPSGWRPHPVKMARIGVQALPLATADAIEWGTRRIDIFILGLFAAPSAVGVYYIAQQVASLPQKLKTSFEPILGPVITRNLKTGDHAAIARQVCQVGFWIVAMQAGIALALGIPGEAVMGLVGPAFVGGTGALAILLAAEVVAATAVISEAVLVYVARVRNLWVSIATIAVQAGLTAGLILLVDRLGYDEPFKAAAAALALALALGMASFIKARMLSRFLGHPINIFRWPLVYAVAPAVLVGWLATFLPEWAELALGVPAILAVYGFVIWTRGFGPEDRLLLGRKGGAARAETPATPLQDDVR
ncbi:lipopolysaccharide biosynthesis protein [Qipengyuania sp.]|uniref:lipopolysaccharide biosynthesis protein n=1 Tax=Qipengyuania sp. TaxID=2004515 RepID=UPI003736A9D5